MAKKAQNSLLGRILILILLLIFIAVIVLGVLEIFIAPDAAKIESQFKNNDKVAVYVTNTQIGAQTLAGAELLSYGYVNTSLLEKVTTAVTIKYKETKDGEDKYYDAMVIYFDSLDNANTARKGIKDKVKEADKVTMFRGKTLVIGDEKAVMRYYYVIH